MKICMENAAEQAAHTTEHQQYSYRDYFKRRQAIRNFNVGDQVIVPICDSGYNLYARWSDHVPFHSYKVEVPIGCDQEYKAQDQEVLTLNA
ncbi:hypothetical protein CDAR_559641 [Caerostris darwini]|uniref:Uncharacterized protein n=1 Tax=Caerostris darwini TaxID=1538125 RepID=A0AAV4TRE4_9ARAC|nr:hypothetical protein CDAR_559641 [Caerostris darwini]